MIVRKYKEVDEVLEKISKEGEGNTINNIITIIDTSDTIIITCNNISSERIAYLATALFHTVCRINFPSPQLRRS